MEGGGKFTNRAMEAMIDGESEGNPGSAKSGEEGRGGRKGSDAKLRVDG